MPGFSLIGTPTTTILVDGDPVDVDCPLEIDIQVESLPRRRRNPWAASGPYDDEADWDITQVRPLYDQFEFLSRKELFALASKWLNGPVGESLLYDSIALL